MIYPWAFLSVAMLLFSWQAQLQEGGLQGYKDYMSLEQYLILKLKEK